MKRNLVVTALSALLWAAPAPGQPGSERDVHENVVQADEPRLMHSASLEYTVAVIALGGLGILVSIGILCMPAPMPDRKAPRTRWVRSRPWRVDRRFSSTSPPWTTIGR